ncbi:hypothetical protein FNF29_07192 [Cafeteria roenbergensis]|uniref:Enoyl reductase (ER) domain-containing protein n=1 Tax=Cafeteria roenbergensis TaxID=33653 RepID=A0A5A8C4Q6_CAFRO|nr:hypothetical protein FNF29_07192 [Cafeteria roenbergensis]KAA0151788.1 hypothetical protein FNF31_06739 [Cafeteria roenbergensis]|eukprot:KAA0147637.1 hypothetical protein FNF29_07192 [Cafeteria roenbergensis]
MASFRKLQVRKLSTNFRDAVEVVPAGNDCPDSGEVAVRVLWAGVNASDVNFTAGKYTPGVSPPFDAGFEALGRVTEAGPDCSLREGDFVVVPTFGAFAERLVVSEAQVMRVPSPDPELLPLLVSGLTAKIAMDRVADLAPGATVLVTAAAGATGQFACQIAKLRGCTVVGTCSTAAKAAMLRSIGVDRAVNYKEEDLGAVLRDEFPRGIDVAYESVGGDMFETALAALRPHGRIVVIGFISGYKDGSGWTGASGGGAAAAKRSAPLPVTLLAKSASVRGFFLNNFRREWAEHFAWLVAAWRRGEIVSRVDAHSVGAFQGLDSVPDAVEWLFSGRSAGKVVVAIDPEAAKEARASRL